MTLSTTMLGNGFAVEFAGIDLADIDDQTFDEVHNSWMQHKVAVFRDQVLSDNELVSFTERMGPLFVHVRDQFRALDRPEIMYISNVEDDGRPLGALGNGDLRWHSDQTYTRRPVFGTILYALEVPKDGGETWFSDLAAAYAAMPEDLRDRVDRRKACYSIEKKTMKRRYDTPQYQKDQAPDQWHPLVRTHPYLDRRALYLSPSHMTGIDDLTFEDTEAEIERLEGWAEQPQFVYKHEWRVNDVVLWDNTSVMHRRAGFPPEQRRFLKRTGFHLPDSLGVPF
jgi:alpha-ketoglutarate-dependent taurine dioxygenase